MKRFVIGTAAVFLMVTIAFFAFVIKNAVRLENYRQELEALQITARGSGAQARRLLDSGRYDLKITMSPALLQRTLAELRGLEIITKGNRAVIRTLRTDLGDGRLVLEVNADFKARFGLYRGPVKATYYGFTRLLENGRCQLDLRVVEAKPLSPHLPVSWIEPWLILKLQKKLKIPRITLPLGLERNLDIPTMRKTISQQKLEITIPGRGIQLRLDDPNVLVTPEFLAILVGDIRFDGEQPRAQDGEQAPVQQRVAARGIAPQTGLHIEMRFRLLSELLRKVIEPPRDLVLEDQAIPGVWRRKKKVLGISVTNKADLKSVAGHVDIRDGGLFREDDHWVMALEARGRLEGIVYGKAYGLSLTAPFVVVPRLRETVPVHFEHREDGLSITFEDRPLVLDLHIETEIAHREVTFNHAIKTSTSEILRPIHVPRLIETTMKIPTRVKRKRVLATKIVDLHLNWNLVLPDDETGFLILEGDLNEGGRAEQDKK